MKADAQTEAAVLAVMKEFAECYAKRDLKGVLALHAPDTDVVIFPSSEKGVGPDELRALVEKNFAQFEAAQFETISWGYGWTSVSAAGSVAWVGADVTLALKGGRQELTQVGRLTWVLENRGGKWLIVHGHVSFPAPE